MPIVYGVQTPPVQSEPDVHFDPTVRNEKWVAETRAKWPCNADTAKPAPNVAYAVFLTELLEYPIIYTVI